MCWRAAEHAHSVSPFNNRNYDYDWLALTQNWKFCHYVFTLLSFQIFFLPQSTKKIYWRILVTEQRQYPFTTIVWTKKQCKSMGSPVVWFPTLLILHSFVFCGRIVVFGWTVPWSLHEYLEEICPLQLLFNVWIKVYDCHVRLLGRHV